MVFEMCIKIDACTTSTHNGIDFFLSKSYDKVESLQSSQFSLSLWIIEITDVYHWTEATATLKYIFINLNKF